MDCENAVDLLHGAGIEMPAINLINGVELFGPARAPQGKAILLPVENPAQGEVQDTFAVVVCRKAVKLPNGLQILLEARTLKFGIISAQVVAGECRSLRHFSREQATAQRSVGKRRNLVTPAIGQHVALDLALKQIVWRLGSMEGRHL